MTMMEMRDETEIKEQRAARANGEEGDDDGGGGGTKAQEKDAADAAQRQRPRPAAVSTPRRREEAAETESEEVKTGESARTPTTTMTMTMTTPGEKKDAGKTPGSGTDSDETPSPLPHMIQLGSDASEEVASWYVETFSNELTEVKRSIKKASKSAKRLSRSPDTGRSSRHTLETGQTRSRSSTQDSGAAGILSEHALGGLLREDATTDDVDSSVSSAFATKLEVALMEAQEQAETRAKEKDLLEQRLECLEEIEELRMKLATSELQALMEQQQEKFSTAPPRWASDDRASSCQRCELPFTFMRWRHHCRRCGRCLCADCAPRDNQAPIPHFGYHLPVRQCLDCLPPEDSPDAKSPATQGLAFTSIDKNPYSGAVDAIRRMENACLRKPTSENLVLTLQSYVHAVERIAKSESLRDRTFRSEAHATLLKSMRTFLQLPQVQGCMREEKTEHAALVESVLTPSNPPSPATAQEHAGAQATAEAE